MPIRFPVPYWVNYIIERPDIPAQKEAAHYHPKTVQYGYNTMPDGEEIYYIPKPALGLRINREAFRE